MFKRFSLIAGIAFLAGCATTSGLDPVVDHSGFDDAKTVTISPHGNDCDSMVCTGIGAQWSEAHPNTVILIVNVFNDTTAVIDAKLNIDGELIELSKTRGVTDLEVSGTAGIYVRRSSKGFVTSTETVRKILDSKRTWLRVSTPTGYLEDPVIDGSADSKAYHALKRFMAEVDA